MIVRSYYGKILQSQNDLKTSACLCASRPSAMIRAALAVVPEEVMSKFYGCGNPIPLGIDGLTVLDLGCGSGRDCRKPNLYHYYTLGVTLFALYVLLLFTMHDDDYCTFCRLRGCHVGGTERSSDWCGHDGRAIVRCAFECVGFC